jgi:hypothetical protein
MAEAVNAFFSAQALQKIPWIADRVVTKMKLFTLKKMVYRGWADIFPQQEHMTGSGDSPIAEEARDPDSIDIVSYWARDAGSLRTP